MIESARIILTSCTNPHRNLALEEALMRDLPAHQAILYLWQNRHTVVIGSGQNAWRECHVKLLQDEGGTLARRSSGGGAVYHDLGNLNFSFILPSEDYDVARQSDVILRAVQAHGIRAERSGRNDLTAEGRKFSGNAFRHTKTACLQHGTLLLHSDMERVARYLNVDPDKLKSKGVKSVPSRVVNLDSLAEVTLESMIEALIASFQAEYGPATIEDADAMIFPGLADLQAHYSDWDWLYAASPAGGEHLEKRFPWGGVELICRIEHGRASHVTVYTDSMDETLKERLEQALSGAIWTGEALRNAASAIGENDIANWLSETV